MTNDDIDNNKKFTIPKMGVYHETLTVDGEVVSDRTFEAPLKQQVNDIEQKIDEILREGIKNCVLANKAGEIATTANGVNDAERGFNYSLAQAKQQLLSLLEETHNNAIDDVKRQGYGYDDGTGFVLKISFAELQALKQPKESNDV